MMETASTTSSSKRGFKFWKKNKRSKDKEGSVPRTIDQQLSCASSSLSRTQYCQSPSTQGSLDGVPEHTKVSSNRSNTHKSSVSNPIHDTNDHVTSTSPLNIESSPPFENVVSPTLQNPTYYQNLNSVIVPPPSLSQDNGRSPIISEKKKITCLARLHKISKAHGVYTSPNLPPTIDPTPNLDQDQQYTEATLDSPLCADDNEGEATGPPIPTGTQPSEEYDSPIDRFHKAYTSPKSVMGDISNQLVTIWNESDFSNVLNCANQKDSIYEDVKRDLCFFSDTPNDRDGFDGDIRIYERYMDMKRRSRLTEEEDDSDSDGQGTYSGRILTVTSRKDRSLEKNVAEVEKSNDGFDTHSSRERLNSPGAIEERLDPLVGDVAGNGKSDDGFDTYSSRDKFNIPDTIEERVDPRVSDVAGNKKSDDGFDTHSSRGRFHSPETIEERLDALVGDVLGGSDDDSLDRMMKLLNLGKDKDSSTITNLVRKNSIDVMPSRIQSSSLPWDERTQGEYDDMPDDEKQSQCHSSRQINIPDDEKEFQPRLSRQGHAEHSHMRCLLSDAKAEVRQYDPLKIVRTASEQSF